MDKPTSEVETVKQDIRDYEVLRREFFGTFLDEEYSSNPESPEVEVEFKPDACYEDVIDWANDKIDQAITSTRTDTIRKAAEIVRTHLLTDWSGEQEVYDQLEEIAIKIESIYSPKETT